MPFEPLRTAIVGLGRMGRFHLGALEAVDELDVVALAEPSPGALAAAGAVRPTATRDTDVLHALAHPGLEACLIASPTPTHPQLVTAALDAGLHVLCEKPLALDADEARSLGARAADLDLVLQVGFWRRFSPPWSALKRCIAAGAIGTPLMVRLSQWDAAAPPAAFCDPAVSGGLAVDCGVHEFDLASWLTAQRITSVSAWSLPIVDVDVGAAGDVDNLVAVLELEAGSERRRHAHRAGGHGGRTHPVQQSPSTRRARGAARDEARRRAPRRRRHVSRGQRGVPRVGGGRRGDEWVGDGAVPRLRRGRRCGGRRRGTRPGGPPHLDGGEGQLPVGADQRAGGDGRDDRRQRFVLARRQERAAARRSAGGRARTAGAGRSGPGRGDRRHPPRRPHGRRAGAGLTFLALHPNAPGELEAIEPATAHIRTDEYHLLRDERFLAWWRAQDVEPIGMRALRDTLRAR